MKKLLIIIILILLTSCATLTYDYDDVYYTENTINFIPRVYYYQTPRLILYWDYTYFGWQQDYYCGYYWCYSCYPYSWYNHNYYPYYYWNWYNTNNHYYGRRYLPSPKPNHERQVQKYTTPNQRPASLKNQKQITPNNQYSTPQQRTIPKYVMPQNNPTKTQSNQNKSYIYNRSAPQPQRTNPVRSSLKTGVKTK